MRTRDWEAGQPSGSRYGFVYDCSLSARYSNRTSQEGYLAKHAAEDADPAADDAQEAMDPMQGLERFDVAGPKTE